MYLDAQNLYSDQQAVTVAAASTNYIDHRAARDLGTGKDIYLVVQVDGEAMDDAGSNSTLAVVLQTDDNTSFSSATNAQTIGTFSAVSASGTRLVAKLQPEKINERYSRVYYTPANGNLSSGKFTAFLTDQAHVWTAYANNYTIS